ncbi:putative protein kinase RLK-Pelle-LRR-XII-1 family [Medicago truncatula]|uniref:non-specific serine/threonine protein kinase n=1 Tax=Medicago truncatula TaxID=3880 RepID=A0A396GJ91_MEDTR|nr:receptor kinase-like protein Xa21 isoform X2 [Medicago truncatula]RHN41179.1 putative protein kinase RLK-Pelle-LRR-XII-1 family [Medicago truncatula]
MVNLLSCLLLVLLSLHYFVACLAANTKNITTDQSALLAFKSLITSDPYDMLANNWSTSSSVCSWVGVTCDERHGRVHSLILQNMSLRGIVSPNLGNMSFLVILDLKNNSFSGQFPKELCRLHKLRVLHISYNKFEGGIPAALGDLSQLQYLYLGANNFSGFVPQSIGKLRQLKELDTIQNRLSGPIPQSISNLSSLERIGLSFNYFSDVASALEYLHHGSSIPVVHCDLKPSNVLLDENMVAHVSDFGIAKLLDEGQSQTHTQTLATIGYLAPEYGSKGIVSVKGDVYSYGIMLMEIFTRRKPTDDMFVAELSLKTWIIGSLPNSIMEVLDSNLVQLTGDTIDDILTHMSSIFSLALNCCEESPDARINMADVIVSLMKIKALVLGANRV